MQLTNYVVMYCAVFYLYVLRAVCVVQYCVRQCRCLPKWKKCLTNKEQSRTNIIIYCGVTSFCSSLKEVALSTEIVRIVSKNKLFANRPSMVLSSDSLQPPSVITSSFVSWSSSLLQSLSSSLIFFFSVTWSEYWSLPQKREKNENIKCSNKEETSMNNIYPACCLIHTPESFNSISLSFWG